MATVEELQEEIHTIETSLKTKRNELRIRLQDELHRLSIILSPMQQRVYEFLVSRNPNKVIAIELGISERTVKFHVSKIYVKMGVKCRQEFYDLYCI